MVTKPHVYIMPKRKVNQKATCQPFLYRSYLQGRASFKPFLNQSKEKNAVTYL